MNSFLNWLNVFNRLTELEQRIKIMAIDLKVQEQQLDSKLADLMNAIGQKDNELVAKFDILIETIEDLKEQIASQAPTIDLVDEIASVDSATAAVQSILNKSTLPPVVPPIEPPTV